MVLLDFNLDAGLLRKMRGPSAAGQISCRLKVLEAWKAQAPHFGRSKQAQNK